MDPNARLKDIKDLFDEIRAGASRNSNDYMAVMLFAVMDHFEELDHWLKIGGFLPDSWNKNRGTK